MTREELKEKLKVGDWIRRGGWGVKYAIVHDIDENGFYVNIIDGIPYGPIRYDFRGGWYIIEKSELAKLSEADVCGQTAAQKRISNGFTQEFDSGFEYFQDKIRGIVSKKEDETAREIEDKILPKIFGYIDNVKWCVYSRFVFKDLVATQAQTTDIMAALSKISELLSTLQFLRSIHFQMQDFSDAGNKLCLHRSFDSDTEDSEPYCQNCKKTMSQITKEKS